MAKQSKAQKDTVERVMHEFMHGELKSGGGRKVRNPKQAIAIALHEAGASNQESPRQNRENLEKTKRKERQGRTGQARAERTRASGRGTTRQALYGEAKRRGVPGRSRMNKEDLARALRK